MDIMEAVRTAIKELILPDLTRIREENQEIKTILTLTNKRLDDVNLHLADQSRRIDETNKRIDSVRDELVKRIDETNKRIDGTNQRMDRLYDVVVRRDEHAQLSQRMNAMEREMAELKRRTAA